MKKLFISISIILASTIYAQKTSGKVVVNNSGEVIGRYIGENKTQYHIEVQDDGWETKKGHKVVLYSAVKGQGVIFPKSSGNVNVRQSPSISSPIVAKIIYNDGELPEVYDCLGLKNGWFTIKINERLGYVKAENMEWDSMNTF